jgi:hypothetical protein
MRDRGKNLNESMERILFSMLCKAHLEQGGKIGLWEISWAQREDDPKGSYSRSQGIVLQPDTTKRITWDDTNNVVVDILTRVKRFEKTLDDVVFYPWGDGDFDASGPTWRILKNYMSFLRIVLKGDMEEMGSILRRLDSIMRDAMYGEDLKKAAENN